MDYAAIARRDFLQGFPFIRIRRFGESPVLLRVTIVFLLKSTTPELELVLHP